MHYEYISLINYRSYKEYQTKLSEEINIIIGPNASGKTNLLESVYVISRGSTFKKSIKNTISTGKERSKIEAIISNKKRTLKTRRLPEEKIEKEFDINSKKYKRLPFGQRVPISLFEPNHLRMLHGSPEGRREFVDQILVQINPAYLIERNKYQRALQQKNRLLKDSPGASDHMFIWNIKLAQHGEFIIENREKIIKEFNKQVSQVYQSLTNTKQKIELIYHSKDRGKSKEEILRNLEDSFLTDKEKGYTTIGPHRDDLLVKIDSTIASTTASRGETRTILLTLKIIEMNLLQKDNNKPIVLLDDVFSELDGKRRKLLTKYLKNYQTIITTTDADVISKDFLGSSNIIPTSIGYQ